MLSILNRQIGNRKRITINTFDNFKSNIISPPGLINEVIITNEYIVVLHIDNSINFYNKFTFNLIHTINNIVPVQGILYIKDNNILIIILDLSGLKSIECNLNTFHFQLIFETVNINYPGFIEYNTSDKIFLIYDNLTYSIYDNNYNKLWGITNKDITQIYSITENNRLFHCIFNDKPFNTSQQCNGITKKNIRCKNKQKFTFCKHHSCNISNIMDPINNKTINTHIIPLKEHINPVLNEYTNNIHFYHFNQNILYCYNFITKQTHQLPFNYNDRLIFINNKYFATFGEKTIIYNYNYQIVFTLDNTLPNNYINGEVICGFIVQYNNIFHLYIINLLTMTIVNKILLIHQVDNITYYEEQSTIAITYTNNKIHILYH